MTGCCRRTVAIASATVAIEQHYPVCGHTGPSVRRLFCRHRVCGFELLDDIGNGMAGKDICGYTDAFHAERATGPGAQSTAAQG